MVVGFGQGGQLARRAGVAGQGKSAPLSRSCTSARPTDPLPGRPVLLPCSARCRDEIQYTMGQHGMSIDHRHTMLLADCMTYKVGWAAGRCGAEVELFAGGLLHIWPL